MPAETKTTSLPPSIPYPDPIRNLCWRCAGGGRVQAIYHTTGGTMQGWMTCDVCKGSGQQQ